MYLNLGVGRLPSWEAAAVAYEGWQGLINTKQTHAHAHPFHTKQEAATSGSATRRGAACRSGGPYFDRVVRACESQPPSIDDDEPGL